jgi:hypothetical protein
MTRPIQEIGAEHLPDVAQDLPIAGGMQAMAAEVDELPFDLETPGIAADRAVALDDGDRSEISPGKADGGSETRRACAENHETTTFSHGSG